MLPCRSKLKITSSALKSRDGVKSFVEWNLTPWRSLKVYSSPSSEALQDSARAGTTLVDPRSNSANRLKIGCEEASKVVPAV